MLRTDAARRSTDILADIKVVRFVRSYCAILVPWIKTKIHAKTSYFIYSFSFLSILFTRSAKAGRGYGSDGIAGSIPAASQKYTVAEKVDVRARQL